MCSRSNWVQNVLWEEWHLELRHYVMGGLHPGRVSSSVFWRPQPNAIFEERTTSTPTRGMLRKGLRHHDTLLEVWSWLPSLFQRNPWPVDNYDWLRLLTARFLNWWDIFVSCKKTCERKTFFIHEPFSPTEQCYWQIHKKTDFFFVKKWKNFELRHFC